MNKKRMCVLLMLMLVLLTACQNKIKDKEVSLETVTQSSIEATASLQEVTTEAMTEVMTEPQTTKPVEVELATDYPYYIKLNRVANCVTVYGKEEGKTEYTVPVIAFACSVGDYVPSNPNSEPTPLGVFNLTDKYEWGLMVDGSYGRYAYRICTDILFHSVPYLGGRVKDGLETDQYNKLGSPASLGCVRLNVRDAKWIFENCPQGTTVEIYDDETNPGPLGKPDTIKIPEDSPYAGWDPTEEDEANPWNQFSAKIEGAADITVKSGEKPEFLKNVTAKDKCGNDITDKIIVVGTYNYSKAGVYDITYKVTDATGSSDEVAVKLYVK